MTAIERLIEAAKDMLDYCQRYDVGAERYDELRNAIAAVEAEERVVSDECIIQISIE